MNYGLVRRFFKSGKGIALSIISAVVIIAVLTAISSENVYAVIAVKNKKVPVYCVQTEEKKIAISFDCAWGTEHTDDILNACDDYGIKVTFFAVEFWVKKNPEYVKKIVSKGHEMGTHSSTHSYMSKLSKEKIKQELASSKSAIEEITGKDVILFRPPYGDYNNTLIECAEEAGLYTIQWDVDSLDWKDLSAKDIAYRVINKVKNGSIILCHNNGLHTAESLPIIFEFLTNKGYSFVPVSELIYKENYVIDQTGRQKPAKND